MASHQIPGTRILLPEEAMLPKTRSVASHNSSTHWPFSDKYYLCARVCGPYIRVNYPAVTSISGPGMAIQYTLPRRGAAKPRVRAPCTPHHARPKGVFL